MLVTARELKDDIVKAAMFAYRAVYPEHSMAPARGLQGYSYCQAHHDQMRQWPVSILCIELECFLDLRAGSAPGGQNLGLLM